MPVDKFCRRGLFEELGNVSKACIIMGVSCDTFYLYREVYDEGGVDTLLS